MRWSTTVTRQPARLVRVPANTRFTDDPAATVVGLAITVPLTVVLAVPAREIVLLSWFVPEPTAMPAPAISTWSVPELEAVVKRVDTAQICQVQPSLGTVNNGWLALEAVKIGLV
jgi:hypothetical protein